MSPGPLDPAPVDLAHEARFSAALHAIYEAALTPDAWPAALSRIGALFAGAGAVIIFYRDHSPAEFIHSPEVRTAVEVYLAEEWWQRDLHAQRAIEQHLTVGDVFSDATVATPEEIATHPIYAEFFRKVGFGWLMSCVLLPETDALVCLSVPRAQARGPFTPREMALLGLVGRHVEQAMRLSLRLGALEVADLVLTAALDALDANVHALTADGRLVMSNRAGEAAFANCFAIVAGRVTARGAEDAARLDALLSEAISAGTGRAVPRASLLTGADGCRHAVWALPLPEAAGRRIGIGEAARVLLLAMAMDGGDAIDPSVLRDLFHLSLGEARVASLVGAGVPLREAAERLGITEGTARLVLKHVFRKVGVHRQAELALRIAALGGVAAPKR